MAVDFNGVHIVCSVQFSYVFGDLWSCNPCMGGRFSANMVGSTFNIEVEMNIKEVIIFGAGNSGDGLAGENMSGFSRGTGMLCE